MNRTPRSAHRAARNPDDDASIAIVLKGYPRLSETFIAQEILGLQKRGLRLAGIALSVAICEELACGRAMLAALFGKRAVPVMVPPCHRIAQEVISELVGPGVRGLSIYTARETVTFDLWLVACNTRLDVLRCEPKQRFLGEEEALKLLIAHLRVRRSFAEWLRVLTTRRRIITLVEDRLATTAGTIGTSGGDLDSRAMDPRERRHV